MAITSGAARYTSERKALFDYMEAVDCTWISRRRSALGVLLGGFACLMDLDADSRFQSWKPVTRGCYLLSEEHSGGLRVQVAHNDFHDTQHFSPGYFFVVNGYHLGKLYIRKRSIIMGSTLHNRRNR